MSEPKMMSELPVRSLQSFRDRTTAFQESLVPLYASIAETERLSREVSESRSLVSSSVTNAR